MEALGQGLAALRDAIGFIGGWIGFVCGAGITASTFFIYTTFEQLKDLLHKDRRYR